MLKKNYILCQAIQFVIIWPIAFVNQCRQSKTKTPTSSLIKIHLIMCRKEKAVPSAASLSHIPL